MMAFMVLGMGSVWADEWSIDFETISKGLPDKTDATLSATSVATISSTAMHTLSYNNGTTTIAFNSNFVVGSNTTWLLRSAGKLYMTINGTRQIGVLNCKANQIITIVTADNKTPTAVTNVTQQSATEGTYVFKVNSDGDVKFNVNNYFAAKSISVENPSTTAVAYTVKYVSDNGTVIKDATTYEGEPGSSAVIYETDKAKINFEGKNYVYTSDDSEGKTIADDGSTVITITFHEAAIYSYNIYAKYDNIELQKLSGQSEEGDAVSYIYQKYYNYNGTLVKKSAVSNSYQRNFTPNADAYTVTDSYTLTDINNVVFFSEAEDISTLTPKTSQYLDIRFSGGQGAYADSEDKVITTLPAGSYKLTAHIMGTKSQCTFTFKAGETVVWEKTTDSDSFYPDRTEYTGDEFTLTEETDIVLVAGGGDGSSSKVMNLIDYIFITGVPTNKLVGTLDYSTNFLGMTSDKVTLSPGSSYQFKFKNYNNGGTDSYKNYLVPVYVGDSNPLVVRSDNFETGDWKNDGCSNNFDWNTNGFAPEMNGATVDMILNYTSDNVFQMLATITTSYNNTWKYFYTSDYSGSKFVSGGSAALTGDIQTALSVEKAFLTILSEKAGATMSLTLSSVGWATLYTPFALDFSGTGLTAYTATVANDQVTLAEVSSVPANTGVVLKGEAGSYEIPIVASSTETKKGDLQGAPATDRWMSDGEDYYMLAHNSETGKVQFTKLTSGSIAAGKAYLVQAKGNGARTLNVVFAEEGTTGIQTLDKTPQADGACYNLNGQRVSQPAKGLYIVNGKKVVIK